MKSENGKSLWHKIRTYEYFSLTSVVVVLILLSSIATIFVLTNLSNQVKENRILCSEAGGEYKEGTFAPQLHGLKGAPSKIYYCELPNGDQVKELYLRMM